MGWGGKWEEGSGWGTHVHPWLIHMNVWQKQPQYCKVISLQLKFKKKKGHYVKTKFDIVDQKPNLLGLATTLKTRNGEFNSPSLN